MTNITGAAMQPIGSLDDVLAAIKAIAASDGATPAQRMERIIRELSLAIGNLDRGSHLMIETALVEANAGFTGTKAAQLVKASISDAKKHHKTTKRQVAQQNTVPQETGRIWIETGLRQLRDIVQDTITVILDHNEQNPTEPILYVRGGVLVRIVKDELCNHSVQQINRAGGKLLLSELADWGRSVEDKETGEQKHLPEYPPNDVVESLLNMGQWSLIPGIESIVSAPVFGRNGELHLEPGYNPHTKLFYTGGAEVGDYSATPENIEKAKNLILGTMLGEFPFVDDASKAHAIAYLILPFIRQLIDGPTPIHNFNAPTEGTGKGMLLEACAIVALGNEPAASKQVDSDDEWRKAITSFLMSGRTHYTIDNINKPLDSGVLASAVTQPIWNDRTLGANREVSLPMRAIWAITANNLAVSGEMARRCVSIRLDANVEHPWERTFEIENLKAWVKEHRNELVTAICTLVKAWIDAGRPKFVGRQKGSFTDWANMIGGILQTVDIPGFLENEDRMHEQAVNTTEMIKGFIERWYKLYERRVVSAGQLFKLASVSDSDAENQLGGWENLLGGELLGIGNQRSRSIKLGGVLTRQRDRVVAGHKITYDHITNGQKYWRLDPADSLSQKIPVECLNDGVECSIECTSSFKHSTEHSTQFLPSTQVRNGVGGAKKTKKVESVECFGSLNNAVWKEKNITILNRNSENYFSDLYTGAAVEHSTLSTDSTDSVSYETGFTAGELYAMENGQRHRKAFSKQVEPVLIAHDDIAAIMGDYQP